MELQLSIVVDQLLEGVTDILYERHDVHLCQRQLASLLFHLAEIENLIDQTKQAHGIAMNQFQLMTFSLITLILDKRIERRDDKGKRCAKLMTYIGEEVEFQFVQLLCLANILLHFLAFILGTLLVDHTLAIREEERHDNEHIDEDSNIGKIERRMHMYLQFADLIALRTISIDHFYLKRIAAWREIGKGYRRTSFGCKNPFVGNTCHTIEKTASGRNCHLAGSQLNGEGIVLAVEVELTTEVE